MVVLLIVWVLCGIVCMMIAQSKNRSVPGFFFLGLLLGLIGVIIAACVPRVDDDPSYGYAYPPQGFAPPPHTFQPAGWYQDPNNGGLLRWFDGYQWTAQTAVIAPPVTPQTLLPSDTNVARPKALGSNSPQL